MPTVGYNARAFTIDNQPELFLSACIHYFRVPHELWADRIAKAKRGGMNTIETYVAWNFHEPEPGVWHWDGDRDLDAFLSECEKQGMYAIVRPGPYICAEWDFGGFPSWLANVPGVQFRRMNGPYLEAADRYFNQVCPIIARHQKTNETSGCVVLVQVENEYANLKWTRGEDMVVDDEYQQYVRDGLLKRGIEVPLITCAGYCSGTVECVNSHNPADQMPGFRAAFPDKPLFSTEFWTAWYDSWLLPHHTRAASDVEYASLRCFAEGACGYNYYVYHGGTNFGYTPMYIQTTSYDYDAQISETGRLTDKWRACKRVALFAQTFRDILLTGDHKPAPNSGVGRSGFRITETRTAQNGGIVWIDNPGKEAVEGSVVPYLPEITLDGRELFPWVHDAPLGFGGKYLHSYAGIVKSDARILCAHIRPDPFDGIRVYVYGTPGEQKEVVLFSGNDKGRAQMVTFSPDAPQVYEVGASQIVSLTADMAGRTFLPPPGSENAPVLLGPDDVRQHDNELAQIELAPGKTHTVFSLLPNGSLNELNVVAPALPEPPPLSDWQTIGEPNYAAPDYNDADWKELSSPTSMLALGNGSNPYGWYRAHVHIPDGEAGDAQLHFSACTDRLTLWVNGEKIGSSAIPPEDRRDGRDWPAQFDIRLQGGDNVLCVLADNLGLIKGDWQIGKGQEHEKKGIYGPVTLTPSGGCYQMDISRWQFMGMLHGERAKWWTPAEWPAENEAASANSANAPVQWHRATFMLDGPLDTATPLLISLAGMGKGVLWVNGHNLGRYWVPQPEPLNPIKAVADWLGGSKIAHASDEPMQTLYYVPEPRLVVGENVVVLVETEGNRPADASVALQWDKNAAALVEVALV